MPKPERLFQFFYNFIKWKALNRIQALPHSIAMSVLSRMGSYCPVCDSHATFRRIAWYRVACFSSRMMTAKGAGQDLILSKNSSLCLCTWSRARFVLVYRNRSSFHAGGPWDAVGAIVFQEKKWDFCVAKVLKLCLWGGKESLPTPQGNRAGSAWIS